MVCVCVCVRVCVCVDLYSLKIEVIHDDNNELCVTSEVTWDYSSAVSACVSEIRASSN